MRLINIAITILAIGVIAVKGSQECSRFSPNEFRASIFEPMLTKELEWLENMYFKALDELDELMDGIRKKRDKDKMEELHELEKEAQEVREAGKELFGANMTADYKTEFKNLVAFDDKKDAKDVAEVRKLLMQVHTTIHAMHMRCYDNFERLANLAKLILRPIAEILKTFIDQSQDKEATLKEMLNKLYNKNHFLGKVLGMYIDKQINAQGFDQPSFLFRTEYIWADLVITYNEKFNEGVEYDDLWRSILEDMWGYDYMKFCQEGQSESECWDFDAVLTMAQVFYHTEWADDMKLPDFYVAKA